MSAKFDEIPLLSFEEALHLDRGARDMVNEGHPLEVPIGLAFGDFARLVKTVNAFRAASAEVLSQFPVVAGMSPEALKAHDDLKKLLNTEKPEVKPQSRLILPR